MAKYYTGGLIPNQDWEAEIAALEQKIAALKSRIKRLKKKLEVGK